MAHKMKYDLLVKDGYVVDPVNKVNGVADVAVIEGKIAAVEPDLDWAVAKKVVSAEGLLVIPGVVDSHVHAARPQARGAGYRMLVKAGVTTAVDFEGPVESVTDEISDYGCGLNVAILEGIRPGFGISRKDAPHDEVAQKVGSALDKGAIGVKLLGGHYPLTPDTTADVIDTAAREGAYVAFHAGSTDTGSNILGLEEAIQLSAGNPLHLAHINAYCRGLVEDPLRELSRAMKALKNAGNIVSESHLAPLNGCSGHIGEDLLPESNVTRNCLRKFGYPVSREGLEKAILEGKAAVYAPVGGEMCYLWREKARERWLEAETRVGVAFAVNLRSSALVCATEKKDSNTFVVDAISSDGGAIPRNFILLQGMLLVHFGALTLEELVLKACYNPARMFGFNTKGHLGRGADADLAILHPRKGDVQITIISGSVVMAGGIPLKIPGCILTTARGKEALERQGHLYSVVDLADSTYFKNIRQNHTKRSSL